MKKFLFLAFLFFASPVLADQIQLALVTASSYGEAIEQPYLVQWVNSYSGYHTFLKEYVAAKALYDKLEIQLHQGGISLEAGVPGFMRLNNKFLILFEDQN